MVNNMNDALLQHMISRGCTEKLIKELHIYGGYDEVAGVDTICFPLWNLFGQLKGIQYYTPNAAKARSNVGRYNTKVVPNYVVLGGLETLNWDHSSPIFLVEGFFDAVKVWNNHLPCIYTCGSIRKDAIQMLGLIPRKKIYLMDPPIDNAGNQSEICKNRRKVSDIMIYPGDIGLDVDLGNMTQEEANKLLEYAFYCLQRNQIQL